MKKLITICACITGVVALEAQSEQRNQQRGGRGNPEAIFNRVDANQDGYVTLEEMTEFRANMPQRGRGGPTPQDRERVEGDDTAAATEPRGKVGSLPTIAVFVSLVMRNTSTASFIFLSLCSPRFS